MDKTNANEELDSWALRHKISHIALNDLLIHLHTYPFTYHIYILRKKLDLSNLPKTSKTLLKTQNKTIVKKMGGGNYYHFGLQREIELLLEFEQFLPSNLLLVVGIDGLAITCNPTQHLWPILGYFSNIPSMKQVFIIGAFLGLT